MSRRSSRAAELQDQDSSGKRSRYSYNNGQDDEEWVAEAQDMIRRCIKHRKGVYFKEPVDPVELGIEDYFDIIKEPMDFKTISKNLDSGGYASQDDFVADMRLIFKNAFTYNTEGDDVWKAAKTMSTFFEENFIKSIEEGEDLDEEQSFSRDPSSSKKAPAPKGGSASKCTATKEVKGDMKISQKYIKPVQEGGWKAGALEIMAELQRSDDACPFVRQDSEGNTTTKKPMDFETVCERLQSGQYIRGGRKDFLRDVRNIFTNALAPQSQQLHARAHKISQLFELEWASLSLVLDRKDASKLAMQEGGGARVTSSVKLEAHFEQLLERLMQNPIAQPLWSQFPPGPSAPAMQQDLYADTCAEQMDFETIREKLKTRGYGKDDFHRCVWLVLNNAKQFFKTDEMRKAGKAALAEVAMEVLQDFEDDFAATMAKTDAEDGASRAISHFPSNPPLELPRTRKPLPRKELPWKDACLRVVEALQSFVRTTAQDSPSDSASNSNFSVTAQVVEKLETLTVRVQQSRHRHMGTFVRECKRALRHCARNGGDASGNKRTGGAHTATGEIDIKVQASVMLQTELKNHLAPIVKAMVASLEMVARDSRDDTDPVKKPPPDGVDEVDDWVQEARALVRSIARHPASWWFRALPSPGTPQLNRYISKVAAPMDLCTMHALLECGHYASLPQMASDVRLMFENVDVALDEHSDQRAMARSLHCTFLSAPSLWDEKELRKARQLERQHAKIAAHEGMGAAALSDAGRMCVELKQQDNWKSVCQKILQQISSLPVAWVLQETALLKDSAPSQLTSPLASRSDSPNKQTPWVPKPIPGLDLVSNRLEENQISDPVQMLVEARHVLMQYMVATDRAPKGEGPPSAAVADSRRRSKGQNSSTQKEEKAGHDDAMDVDGIGLVGKNASRGNDDTNGVKEGLSEGEQEEEEEDDEEETNEYEYVADEEETLRNIAKKFNLTPEALNAYNKPYIPGITVNARVLRGTVVRIPPRQPDLIKALPPPQPVKVDVSIQALRCRAAERVLIDLDMLFKDAFFSRKHVDNEPNSDSNVHPEAMPIVKYRKSQRFYHCKVPHNLVFIAQVLEKMIKHPVWANISERLETEDPKSVANPMDLALVRANIELGLYADADSVIHDIRLALVNARNVCRDPSASTKYDLQVLEFILGDFERELHAGKMHMLAFGLGENRQLLPLSKPVFAQLAKDLVDRVTDRPDTEPFLRPVRPIEDGCADYADVIREPMDLGSIRDRLDMPACGGYEMLADVVADVILVFKNAMTYNGEKSQIYEDAAEALKAFEADLAETLENVCTKGIDGNEAKEGGDANEDDSLDSVQPCAQVEGGLRPEYVPPQVVAGVLQSKLEEWDRKCNWIDSFDEKIPLPAGWHVVYESKTNKVYYWKKSNNKTQWEQPGAPSIAKPTPLVPSCPRPTSSTEDAPTAAPASGVAASGIATDPTAAGGCAKTSEESHSAPLSGAIDTVTKAGSSQEIDEPVVKSEQAPASQSAFLAGDAPEKMELDAPVAKEACSKVADSSEANAPNGNAPSQDPALREPRMLSSPYAGRYYCPIFCCWRPLKTEDQTSYIRDT